MRSFIRQPFHVRLGIALVQWGLIFGMIGVPIWFFNLSPVDLFSGYSDGTRVGTVVKLSKKGVICKTYEGELKVGSQTTAIPETWKFSVTDESVVEKLNSAMLSGAQVGLHYDEPLIRGFCKGSSEYRIIGVE